MSFARSLVHRLPQPLLDPARRVADAVVPHRRDVAAQWLRIDKALQGAQDRVQSGPFAGMRLGAAATGSHVPKRLGTYEQELHFWVEYFVAQDYAEVIDVGCGEGYYVVGLARRLPATRVTGYDSSTVAQKQCRQAAELNGVSSQVVVEGLCSPEALALAADHGALVIIDAEGAEVGLLTETPSAALARLDLLVELHDFLVPGATQAVRSLLESTHEIHLLGVSARSADGHPLLALLSDADRRRALDESRPPSQQWLVALSSSRERTDGHPQPA